MKPSRFSRLSASILAGFFCSTSTFGFQEPARHDFVALDGTTLSGRFAVDSFVVPAGVDVTVDGDLVVESRGDIVVEGILALPAEPWLARGGSITLRAGGVLEVRGMLLAGDGADARLIGEQGERGGDLVLEAPWILVPDDLSAGRGGAGGPGGRGGDGGDILVAGNLLQTVTIRGGRGGRGGHGLPGQRGGQGGGGGGAALPDGSNGSAGTNGSDTTGGSGANGTPGGACAPGTAGAVGGNAIGGAGGPGGHGGNAIAPNGNGGKGGHGGRGGDGFGGSGGSGGNGGDCCCPDAPGGAGGPGAPAGNGFGGDGGPAGNGGNGVGTGVGGNGGNGGGGGNGTGGNGGSGGDGGNGVGPGGGGLAGGPGTGGGGAGGAFGSGGAPGGVNGFPGSVGGAAGGGAGANGKAGDTCAQKFCAGDGSAAPCPCGNFGSPGHGCANSAGALGAGLFSTGRASVSDDTFVLLGSGMGPTATALYFQGTAPIAGGLGAPFGDGLRCVGGSVIRLGIKTSVEGSSSYPDADDELVSVKGLVPIGGAERLYQLWYRDVVGPCATGFNLSNALRVVWQP